ncbi:MAG: chemotaxis response regulator protein-glutamate methylesterase [Acidobacteria bacterium]|nr:chemotaxis response regulator protein-glutamate methylesterase [Acidobacteriota bacterium]
MSPSPPIRVLIVDDSAIVRKVLSGLLADEPDIEVVGTAPDPIVARQKILSLSPDVITLDLEMPRMDGLTFLDKLMKHHPLPVIVLSSLAYNAPGIALDALRRGAVDVIPKPGGPYSVGDLKSELGRRIRSAAKARLGVRAQATLPTVTTPGVIAAAAAPALAPVARQHAVRLILVGASTGGTVAIEQLLREFPADMPPIAVVQHIPAGFSKAFADRLNTVCRLNVAEARDGDVLSAGSVFIAPGNWHMELDEAGTAFRARLHDGAKVCYQRPAVDVLFKSAVPYAGSDCVAVILTGMGNDGAEGMRLLHQRGAGTYAQNEASCVVYGMPREAVLLGGVDGVGTPAEIAQQVTGRCRGQRPANASLRAS